MNRFKSVSWKAETAGKELPDPETLWDRAHSTPPREQVLVKKALRPLVFARLAAYAVSAIALVVLIVSNARAISGFLRANPLSRSVMDSLAATAQSSPQWLLLFIIPMAIVFVSMGFCGLASVFAEHRKKAV
jgi:hypothetical protein